MRFVIGVVLALSVGIGAYLGSAQAAGSAKTPPRRVTLRLGDVAAFGKVQCLANTEVRGHPIHDPSAYLQCSKGPVSHAAVVVAVRGFGVGVEKKAGQVWCGWGESSRAADPVYGGLTCHMERPRKHLSLSVKVLPGVPGVPGGIAFFKDDKMVYRAGWDPG